MDVYKILTLFSVPTLVGSMILYVRSQIKAIKSGVQALLRAQMISLWNQYSDKGYAPIYERENFENIYQQYHSLGANGVMDDIRQKFLALPIKEGKTNE